MATQGRDDIFTPANVVTISRILLIPVFVAILLAPWPSWIPNVPFWQMLQPWIAAATFAILAATDSVDGYLARSRNQVTDLGKFLDPLADKILVCAALLALVELQNLPSWIALVILAREFIVSGLRMVAAVEGVVIAASWYGKVKTVLQIAAILLFIVKYALHYEVQMGGFATGFTIFSWIVMACAVVMTLISMFDYFSKSKELLGFVGRNG